MKRTTPTSPVVAALLIILELNLQVRGYEAYVYRVRALTNPAYEPISRNDSRA